MRLSPEEHFRIQAGATELDVAVYGTGYDGVDALVNDRLAAFVDRPDHPARRVRCRFHFSDQSWLAHDPDRAAEPIAERRADGAWHAEWAYYHGDFGPSRADAVLARRHPSLEHALRGAAVFAAMPDELYVHAATLVYGERAWLFAGHPNAGKSTIAREGAADRVISNEISILGQRSDGTWEARPSPFWGTGDAAHWSAPAPLAGIVVLSQSEDGNRWRAVDGARAVQALLPHLACQAAAQLSEPALLSRIAGLTGALPTRTLAWYRPSHPMEGSEWRP